MKKVLFTFISIGLISISGCTLYKNAKVPKIVTPQSFQFVPFKHLSTLNGCWWRNFHDDSLNRYVECALKNNYNYRIAIKNIDIAHTYVTQNISALFPQINLTVGGSRNKLSTATGNDGVRFTPNPGTEAAPFSLLQLTTSSL